MNYSMNTPNGWIYSRWGWLGACGIVLLVVIVIVLLGTLLGAHPWSDVAPEVARQYASEQCEAITKDGFLLQQANFWSNFAYLAAGLLIWLRNRTVTGIWTGIMFCFLAVGSGYFHGTLTSSGQYLDIIGIYAALTALVIKGVFEAFNLELPGPVAGGCFFAGWMLSVFAGVYKNDVALFDSDLWTLILGGALAVLAAIGGFLCRGRWSSYVWPMGAVAIGFIVAAVFKYGDGEGNFLCSLFGSNPVIQGHALWHVASAFGLLSAWELFNSLRRDSGAVRVWRE